MSKMNLILMMVAILTILALTAIIASAPAIYAQSKVDSDDLAKFTALMQYIRSQPTPSDVKADNIPFLATLDTALSDIYITGFITPYTGETPEQVKARLLFIPEADRFTAVMVESYRLTSNPLLLNIIHQLLPLYYVEFFTTAEDLNASAEFLKSADINSRTDAFDPTDYAMPAPSATQTPGGTSPSAQTASDVDSDDLAKFTALMQYIRSQPTPSDVKAANIPFLATLDTALSDIYITGFITPYTGETADQVKARLQSVPADDRFTAVMVESYRLTSNPLLLNIIHQLLPLYYVEFFTTAEDLNASAEFLKSVKIENLADAFNPTDYAMPAPSATGSLTPTPAQVAVVSEGVAAHGADLWQVAGFTGKGVKIGIIDAGYDSYHSLAGSELPLNVEVLCFTDISGRSSSDIGDCSYPGNPEWVNKHGTGAMEVIFDFAPDAAYYVTNFHHGLDNLRKAVDWMIANGVDVINASQGFSWSGPGDGTSPYSNSIFRIVDAAVSGGAVWVNAADNARFSSWLGPFNDPDGNGYHNFLGDDECNGVSVQIRDFAFSSSLRWEDDWPGAVSDLNLYVRDASGNVVLQSEGFQRGGEFDLPIEVIKLDPDAEGTYCLAVRHQRGPQPGWIEFTVVQLFELEHFTDGGGLNTAAESRNPGLLAVGAAHWRDTHTIMPYSSRGPTTDGRIKPDITGATNGWSVGFGGEYGGTSGASPHIAGLAALVKSRFPDYSPEEVANYLKNNAEPRGDVPNNAWGYGFARLPAEDGIEIPPSPDRDALIAFYHATGGPNWQDQENWLSDKHIAEWHGVEIDRQNRVVKLNLNRNQLTGTMPTELSSLSNLQALNLRGNQISGMIPPLLKDLHSLQDLDLGSNWLSGDIPPELGDLANLTSLNLGTNQLNGEIPAELSNLGNLTYLYLDNNRLSDGIPSELGRLSNLRELSLWSNQLDGPIPPELGGLSNLTYLVLGINELSGEVPPQLANLSNLDQLWLDNNQLTGGIPAELGNLSNLRVLSLWANQLDGPIPPELSNLSNLESLYLSYNQLTGSIPPELGKLTDLEQLYLGDNDLTGCIPAGLRDVPTNDFDELGLPFCDP